MSYLLAIVAARLAVLLFVLFLGWALSGCAIHDRPKPSLDMIQQDANTCAATRTRFCLGELWLYLEWVLTLGPPVKAPP